MKFQTACKVTDLKVGAKKVFKVNGKRVIVYHTKKGFFASALLCPHTLAPLIAGKVIKDSCIRCPLHRAEFDLKNGDVKKWANFPPGIQLLNVVRGEKNLECYDVQVTEDEVQVYLPTK